MKNIKWKHNSKLNTYEGTIKGDIEPLIFIEGSLCVTDIWFNCSLKFILNIL